MGVLLWGDEAARPFRLGEPLMGVGGCHIWFLSVKLVGFGRAECGPMQGPSCPPRGEGTPPPANLMVGKLLIVPCQIDL